MSECPGCNFVNRNHRRDCPTKKPAPPAPKGEDTPREHTIECGYMYPMTDLVCRLDHGHEGWHRTEDNQLFSSPKSAPKGEDLGVVQELPLDHKRNCAAWKDMHGYDAGDRCTCGLRWRIMLQTEQTMHAAWRKRAEESESESAALREAVATLSSRCESLQGEVDSAWDAANKKGHALIEAEADLARERELVRELREALGNFYDKWENGTPCQEADEDGIIEGGSNIGNAVKLSFAEEQTILNLIVDKPEPHEQACANCGKPYRAHLLHDGNKCSLGSVNGWFPKSIADALLAPRSESAPKPDTEGEEK